MNPYPFLLSIALKIFKIISALIPNANLRRNARNLPFIISRHICQISKQNLIKADIFISIGDACKPALHLREYGLRKLSSPLDWMYNYSLDEAHRCFCVEFGNFFEKCYDSDKAEGKERNVISISNDEMISIHAFPKNVALDEYLPTFRAKMQRRFQKIKAKIIDSQTIALVISRNDSVDKIANFGRKMQILFKNWGGGILQKIANYHKYLPQR